MAAVERVFGSRAEIEQTATLPHPARATLSGLAHSGLRA
jgi:hypothetical protein